MYPCTHRPVILWHVLRRIPEDVANDAHGRRRWVDEGVAHHKLLQDVVLDRALEKVLCRPLLFGRCYVPEANRGQGHNLKFKRSQYDDGWACVMQARCWVLDRPGVSLHCTLHISYLPVTIDIDTDTAALLYGESGAARKKYGLNAVLKIFCDA